MLRRSLCLIALLAVVTVLAGCLVTQDSYVKKEDEANTLSKTVAGLDQKNKELAAQNEKLQAENSDLRKQAAEKDDLLQKKSEEIAKQDAKQAEMVNEMDRMKAQLAKSREVAIEESPAKKQAGLKSIRLKVLSGDGKIDSARQMAKRITSMGYRVENVGMADNSDYPASMVYFAPKYNQEAKALAKKLGKETITKPLSWKSVFNIIVVTGG
ncbi:MAG TPA: LytR C-terminal domain-containing protein [Syntrophales bacterium]|nr:LytR C-terminal domain-containing protein [Syntrophales bacterium]